jgi:hypothetical protein
MDRIVIIALLVLAFTASTCRAGDEDVKVALHVQEHDADQSCDNLPAIAGCGDISTTYSGCGEVDVFTVFFDFDGCTGAEWALTWPEEWGTALTTSCGDFTIGTITAPGDWVATTWSTCQPGPAIIPAWTRLTAGGPGRVDPIPKYRPGRMDYFLGIANCSFAEINVMCAFGVGVCGMYGGDPCGPTASEPTTWGLIKGMFR